MHQQVEVRCVRGPVRLGDTRSISRVCQYATDARTSVRQLAIDSCRRKPRASARPRLPYHLATCLESPDVMPRQGRLPSTRRLAWLLVRDPDALAHTHQDPEVAALHDLARPYTRMVREKRPDDLDGWLVASGRSEIGALVSSAEGLRRDYAAVRAALAEPWSSGQAEGQINRLKMLKRQMYGRAGFDLLRKLVLCTA